jgi:hypothetical protein
MEEIIREVNREEFIELLRNEFIPYLVRNNNMKSDIPLYQKDGMFNKWTLFFYCENNICQTVKIK